MVSSQVRQDRPQAGRFRASSGEKLGALGQDILSLSLRLWFLLVHDLAPELPLEVLRSRWVALEALTFRSLLEALDALAKAHLSVVSGKNPPSFIRDVVRSVPNQLRGLIHQLEGEIGPLSSMEWVSVRAWRTILTFLLRPDYPDLVEKQDVITAWVDRVSQDRYNPELSWEVFSSFSMYTSVALSSRVKELYAPTHGPGAVTIQLDRGKTSSLTPNQKDRLLSNCPLMRMLGEERFFAELPRGDDPVPKATVLTVPKTWEKHRVIAVETATRMYVQKGIQRALYKALKEDPFWSRHIDFAHPEKGYSLVTIGSQTGRYATVDLSAASDSVSVALVQDMLCGSKTSDLLSWLMRARSSSARLPDGRNVRLKTFATMGNAFCFPIETLAFGTLCIVSILRSGGDPTHSRFRVYGDDIIIESEYLGVLIEVLTQAGFSVNDEKTFGGASSFKESCGLECFKGKPVTPLRLPRTFGPPSKGLQSRSAWVDLANRATRFGLLGLAREIRCLLVREWRLPIPFTPDGFLGLIGNDNSHLVHQWDPEHCAVGYAYPVNTVRTVDREKQLLALSERLADTQGEVLLEEIPGELDVNPAPFHSRVDSGRVRHEIAVLYGSFT